MSAALRAVPAMPAATVVKPMVAVPQVSSAATSKGAQAATALQTDTEEPGQTEPNKRVLRMLTGTHTGAESELHSDRLLIGNLESECDVVLDVSRPERHICLVRASSDGWTVLSIAGDLWVGDSYVEAQHTRDIASGMVLTLGRVAFCIANTVEIDWASIKVPTNLSKPEAAGPVPIAVLPPSGPAKLHKWHALKFACGIGVAALTMASAGAYLTSAWTLRTPAAEEAVARIKAHQAMVKALPYGKELQVQALPEVGAPNRELVQGYLPKREQVRALERALREAEVDAEFRIHAIDDMSVELARRFERIKASDIRYDTQGRFVIDSKSATLDLHDRQARQTLQEVPAVAGLSLSVADVLDPAGKPIVVRYERSTDRPGDITVTELDVIRQRLNFHVREMRLGTVPSIVLDNGMRYFEGATLPDSSVLKRISATELVVTQGRGERIIPLQQTDDKAGPTPTSATGSSSATNPAGALAAPNSAGATALSTAISAAAAVQRP
jgi:Inner membrane component of T3SS, cytoplasmic domain/Inner membrane component of T3SS, periplasmic domain